MNLAVKWDLSNYRVHSQVKPLMTFLQQQLLFYLLTLWKLSGREEIFSSVPAWFIYIMNLWHAVSLAKASYHLVPANNQEEGQKLVLLWESSGVSIANNLLRNIQPLVLHILFNNLGKSGTTVMVVTKALWLDFIFAPKKGVYAWYCKPRKRIQC